MAIVIDDTARLAFNMTFEIVPGSDNNDWIFPQKHMDIVRNEGKTINCQTDEHNECTSCNCICHGER